MTSLVNLAQIFNTAQSFHVSLYIRKENKKKKRQFDRI